MNTPIALGAALVLALGSAVGSTALSTRDEVPSAVATGRAASSADVTPEMLTTWKVTAASADYTPPRLPI